VEILLSFVAFLGATPGQIFPSEPYPLLNLPGCSQRFGSAEEAADGTDARWSRDWLKINRQDVTDATVIPGLPPGCTLSFEFREGSCAGPKTTIGEKMRQLHAFVLDGKLYDGAWREVFFVKPAHLWCGAMLPNEVLQREYDEIRQLEKIGIVILMAPLSPVP
jgi:hypothetical protein